MGRKNGLITCRSCRQQAPSETYPGASQVCVACIPVDDTRRVRNRGKRGREHPRHSTGPYANGAEARDWIRRLSAFQQQCSDLWEPVAIAGSPIPTSPTTAVVNVRLRNDSRFESWHFRKVEGRFVTERGKRRWRVAPSCVRVCISVPEEVPY